MSRATVRNAKSNGALNGLLPSRGTEPHAEQCNGLLDGGGGFTNGSSHGQPILDEKQSLQDTNCFSRAQADNRAATRAGASRTATSQLILSARCYSMEALVDWRSGELLFRRGIRRGY